MSRSGAYERVGAAATPGTSPAGATTPDASGTAPAALAALELTPLGHESIHRSGADARATTTPASAGWGRDLAAARQLAHDDEFGDRDAILPPNTGVDTSMLAGSSGSDWGPAVPAGRRGWCGPKQPVPWRYRVVLLCTVSNLVCYADRTNISVALIPMSRDAGWSVQQQGLILSAFWVGYVGTQILGGWAAHPDRMGGRAVLATGVFLWSIFTALTPMAALSSLPLLLAARVSMGLGEGVSMPSIHALLGVWVLPSERTRAVAIATGGQHLGTVVALLSSPLVEWWWPSVFYLYGIAGCLFAVALWKYTAAHPSMHPRISSVEMDLIAAGTEPDEAATGSSGADDGDGHYRTVGSGGVEGVDGVPPGGDDVGTAAEAAHRGASSLLARALPPMDAGTDVEDGDEDVDQGDNVGDGDARHRRAALRRQGSVDPSASPCGALGRLLCAFAQRRQVWAVIIAHFAHNFCFVIVLSWMPRYFHSLGLGISGSGLASLGPFAFAWAFTTGWSFLADWLIASRTLTRLGTRKLTQTVAFVTPASCLAALAFYRVRSPSVAFALLCVGVGVNACSHSGFWANIIDLTPRHAGSLLGVSNSWGNVAGALAPLISGWLLDKMGGVEEERAWAAVFWLATAVYGVGLLAYLTMAGARVLFP